MSRLGRQRQEFRARPHLVPARGFGAFPAELPASGPVSAYFEGKLAKPEARELELHLSGCSGCQAELAALLRLQPAPATEADAAEAGRTGSARSGVKAEPPPEPDKVTPPSQPAVERRRSRRARRTLWTWVGPVALAASAVLAIGVTYRFAPLIGEALRKSRESELRARATGERRPLAASRDRTRAIKEAPAGTQRRPPDDRCESAAPPVLDTMQAAESRSALADSMPREETDMLARAPTVKPTAITRRTDLRPLRPSRCVLERPRRSFRTKQAAKDERTLEAFARSGGTGAGGRGKRRRRRKAMSRRQTAARHHRAYRVTTSLGG